MKLFKCAIAATVALGAVASGSAIAAEKKINAITSLQPTNVLAKAFLQKFVAVLNKSSKGIVSIKYVGGQEVVPPRKAAARRCRKERFLGVRFARNDREGAPQKKE